MIANIPIVAIAVFIFHMVKADGSVLGHIKPGRSHVIEGPGRVDGLYCFQCQY
ncbi:hypothetical protein QUA35_03610 [Microcoleus sp. N9_B2]|uniref:hypothetical protein n=1 Tax=unclassified Microcoleus TaxID=2642155 RepID=UPI002FD51F80